MYHTPWMIYVIGIVTLGTVSYIMYQYHRTQSHRQRSQPEISILIAGNKKGDTEVSVYFKDGLTIHEIDQIMRDALLKKGKTDHVVIRLLFHNCLLALGEDESFRTWYQQETGVDLREAVSYHASGD